MKYGTGKFSHCFFQAGLPWKGIGYMSIINKIINK